MMSDGTQAIIVTQELTKEQKDYIKSKFKRVVKTHCIAVDAVALITNKGKPRHVTVYERDRRHTQRQDNTLESACGKRHYIHKTCV